MTPIEDILRDHNIPHKREGEHKNVRTGWVGVMCPFCLHIGTSGGFTLGINTSGGYSTCWVCGPHTLSEVLTALGVPQATARRHAKAARRRPYAPQQRHSGRYTPPRGVGPLGKPHRRYLISRGFDPDTLEKLWGLGGIGVSPQELAWRIFIPVLHRGTPVTWTTRSIAPTAAKRYHAATAAQSAADPHSVVYGADYVRHAVVVHEGPTDVWATGPGAVCTLGAGYSRAQLLELSRYPKIVVCFDSEPAAQARARRLADDLALYGGRCYNVCLDAPDPATAGPEELAALRRMIA